MLLLKLTIRQLLLHAPHIKLKLLISLACFDPAHQYDQQIRLKLSSDSLVMYLIRDELMNIVLRCLK
ncbi:hypothetical protein BZY94_31025 [Burkholderia territorii]|nr:hypothetical protein BZY94_31025 [Burkholderia territorii]